MDDDVVVNIHAGHRPERFDKPFTADKLKARLLRARLFNFSGLVPVGVVTLLGGEGGGGKSLLGLQACVATAIGKPWLGRDPLKGRALYLSAEDDVDEVHRRLGDLCTHYEVGIEDLADLKVWPYADLDALLAVSDDRGRAVVTTPLWDDLQAEIRAWKPVLIVLDSLADVYGGDENHRAQVRQFIGHLRRMAMAAEAGVLLLAHPSLNGISSGSGLSGSTAWNNSVRSRLYLSKSTEEGADPDLRTLSVKKANYSPAGGDLRIYRRAGAFVVDQDAPSSSLDMAVQKRRVDDTFLELLTTYEAQGRHVSDKPSANYAPTVFARDPAAKSTSRKGLEGAMNRLFAAGQIRVEMVGRPARQLRKLTRVAPADPGGEA